MLPTHPTRFIGMTAVAPRDPNWFAAEFRRGAAMSFIGPLIYRPVVDKLNARFPEASRAHVALFAMVASSLISFWVYFASNATRFYPRFVPFSLVFTGWLPPLYAIINDQVLPRMRGITTRVLPTYSEAGLLTRTDGRTPSPL